MRATSDEVLEFVGLVKGNHGVFDGDRALFAELTQGAGYGLTCCAGHGCHFFVGEEQREAVAAVYVFADLVGKFEKQSSEAACNSLSKGDAAGVLQGEAVFLADALNGAHLGLAVVTQEGEEPFAFDWAELCGGQRLG